ncbi:hypothetical protein [Chroococcidiopsis sp.]|uniref:hypothetical protein n=1 Tax=Chroococcidiopsis sp. TaxID=3088168 RepID=UPI003F66FF99
MSMFIGFLIGLLLAFPLGGMVGYLFGIVTTQFYSAIVDETISLFSQPKESEGTTTDS